MTTHLPFSLQALVCQTFGVGQTFATCEVMALIAKARQDHGLPAPNHTAAACLFRHMERRGLVRRTGTQRRARGPLMVLWEMVCHDAPHKPQPRQVEAQERRKVQEQVLLEAWATVEPHQRRAWLEEAHGLVGLERKPFVMLWGRLCSTRPHLLPIQRTGWATPQEVEQTPTPEAPSNAEKARQMLALGFSQGEIARRLGISKQRAQQFEKERDAPELDAPEDKTKRPYLRHDHAKIRALIEQGKTAPQIRAETGAPLHATRQIAAKYGLKTKT